MHALFNLSSQSMLYYYPHFTDKKGKAERRLSYSPKVRQVVKDRGHSNAELLISKSDISN